MNQTQTIVANDEQVARLVNQEWVVDGVLQVAAFVQAPLETYLSVNRLSIDSYSVEVEPREAHTRSHAGIFVRVKGRNVVPGRQLPNGQLPNNVSEEMLLQRVQWELHDLAELQRQKLLHHQSKA